MEFNLEKFLRWENNNDLSIFCIVITEFHVILISVISFLFIVLFQYRSSPIPFSTSAPPVHEHLALLYGIHFHGPIYVSPFSMH